ncbi:MAG: hypothetical protein ACRDRH_11055 [Pseudonocardia sp.]
MPSNDPIMAVLDRIPLARRPELRAVDDTSTDPGASTGEPVPFGLRFAVDPVTPSDKHKKTYYTVTVKEATKITEDGTVKTIKDDVERERED